MPNPALKAMLELSAMAESGQVPAFGDPTASPLSEADPHSLDELFARVNDHLLSGLPEAITDADLAPMALRLRAQRLNWNQETERKGSNRERKKRGEPTVPKAALEPIAVDLSDLL